MPGALSVDRALSTAHGWTASIAARTLPGPSPPAEHHAPRSRARALEMLRIGLFPRQVDDRTDAFAGAQEHGVAGSVPVLAGVELHEIGIGLRSFPDEHGDAQDRRRRREQSFGPRAGSRPRG